MWKYDLIFYIYLFAFVARNLQFIEAARSARKKNIYIYIRMSIDSLWEACRRAYIEHKSGDLCETCKNNYTKSSDSLSLSLSFSEQVCQLRLCVYVVCASVLLKIHYIIY